MRSVGGRAAGWRTITLIYGLSSCYYEEEGKSSAVHGNDAASPISSARTPPASLLALRFNQPSTFQTSSSSSFLKNLSSSSRVSRQVTHETLAVLSPLSSSDDARHKSGSALGRDGSSHTMLFSGPSSFFKISISSLVSFWRLWLESFSV